MSPNELLPLYYGAPALNDRAEFVRVNLDTISRALGYGERFKLVLRPPSSITVAELQTLAWIDSRDNAIIKQSVRAISRGDDGWVISYSRAGDKAIRREKKIALNSLTPEQTFYLLRLAIDIYRLIEEGWAINETTLNKAKRSLTPWKVEEIIGIKKT